MCYSNSDNFGKWNSIEQLPHFQSISFYFESKFWAFYINETIEKLEPTVTFVLKVSLALSRGYFSLFSFLQSTRQTQFDPGTGNEKGSHIHTHSELNRILSSINQVSCKT